MTEQATEYKCPICGKEIKSKRIYDAKSTCIISCGCWGTYMPYSTTSIPLDKLEEWAKEQYMDTMKNVQTRWGATE